MGGSLLVVKNNYLDVMYTGAVDLSRRGEGETAERLFGEPKGK